MKPKKTVILLLVAIASTVNGSESSDPFHGDGLDRNTQAIAIDKK